MSQFSLLSSVLVPDGVYSNSDLALQDSDGNTVLLCRFFELPDLTAPFNVCSPIYIVTCERQDLRSPALLVKTRTSASVCAFAGYINILCGPMVGADRKSSNSDDFGAFVLPSCGVDLSKTDSGDSLYLLNGKCPVFSRHKHKLCLYSRTRMPTQ